MNITQMQFAQMALKAIRDAAYWLRKANCPEPAAIDGLAAIGDWLESRIKSAKEAAK